MIDRNDICDVCGKLWRFGDDVIDITDDGIQFVCRACWLHLYDGINAEEHIWDMNGKALPGHPGL